MAPFVEFDLAVIIHSTTESVRLYGTPVSIGGKTPNMLTVRSGRQTVSCRGLAVPGARNTHFLSTSHYIDIISLYAQLKNSDDERIKIALEELLKEENL